MASVQPFGSRSRPSVAPIPGHGGPRSTKRRAAEADIDIDLGCDARPHKRPRLESARPAARPGRPGPTAFGVPQLRPCPYAPPRPPPTLVQAPSSDTKAHAPTQKGYDEVAALGLVDALGALGSMRLAPRLGTLASHPNYRRLTPPVRQVLALEAAEHQNTPGRDVLTELLTCEWFAAAPTDDQARFILLATYIRSCIAAAVQAQAAAAHAPPAPQVLNNAWTVLVALVPWVAFDTIAESGTTDPDGTVTFSRALVAPPWENDNSEVDVGVLCDTLAHEVTHFAVAKRGLYRPTNAEQGAVDAFFEEYHCYYRGAQAAGQAPTKQWAADTCLEIIGGYEGMSWAALTSPAVSNADSYKLHAFLSRLQIHGVAGAPWPNGAGAPPPSPCFMVCAAPNDPAPTPAQAYAQPALPWA